jgi:methylglyoxal synthase
MDIVRRIALVAHDHRKQDLIEWVEWNWSILVEHQLVCTGTTGKLVEEALLRKLDGREIFKYPIRKLKSGPLGGDQQLGMEYTPMLKDYTEYINRVVED